MYKATAIDVLTAMGNLSQSVDSPAVIAIHRGDRFIIRRWDEGLQQLVVLPGHEGQYVDVDVYRRFARLRVLGNHTYIHEPDGYHLITD